MAVDVIVKSAKPIDGFYRSDLMIKAAELPDSHLRQMAAFYLYPTCVASVKEPQWVHDMSFEDFISKVDEADMDAWATAAYELNPQWQARNKTLAQFTAAEEKKTGMSPSGSPMPTDQSKKPATSRPSKNAPSTGSPTTS